MLKPICEIYVRL